MILNGTYVFNERVNYPYDCPSFFGLEYYVPFYCNGILCSGMNFGSTGMEEIDFTGLGFAYQGFGMGWQNEAYRTVKFDNQPVSDEFYNWLTANTSLAKTLDGIYIFNEQLWVGEVIDEFVTFTSNGRTFSKISAYLLPEISYDGMSVFQGIDVGSGAGWLLGEAYRTVTFDNQGVSEAFYNFVTSNATLDKTVYTIEKFTLKKIADAIRSKRGTTAALPVTEFAAEIKNI